MSPRLRSPAVPIWTPANYYPSCQQHAGEPFSRDKIDQSIAALKSAGNFSEVQLQVEPEANGVRVLLIVEPAVWFGIFEFPGAERFNYSRLVQVANYPPQAPFNAGDVQKDTDALLRFFQQEGYFEAEVRPQVNLDTAHNLANVRFMVSLNRRAKFGTVAIADTTPEASCRNEQEPSGSEGAGEGSGDSARKELSPRNADQCPAISAKAAGEEGQAGRAGKARREPPTMRRPIAPISTLMCKPGPTIHVEVKGAHLWSWTSKSLLPVYQGVGVDPELVQEGRAGAGLLLSEQRIF